MVMLHFTTEEQNTNTLMANPNTLHPTGETQPAPEMHLDDKRILEAIPFTQELATPNARRVFEQILGEVLIEGRIYETNERNERVVTDTFDPSPLREAYLEACQEMMARPDAKTSGDGIYRNYTDLPLGSYASALVANYPHPEEFLQLMCRQFDAAHPDRDASTEEGFTENLDRLAGFLYGKRYDEYEAQVEAASGSSPANRETQPLGFGNAPTKERYYDNHVIRGAEIFDTKRILDTPTPVDGFIAAESMVSLEKAHVVYDSDVQDAINGHVVRIEPDGTRFIQEIDTTTLKAMYWKVCKESSVPGTMSTGQHGIFIDDELPAGSYASRVVVNNPHPELFLASMHEHFLKNYPNANEAERASFTAGLENLASKLYGARYTEYQEQRHDLGAVDPSVAGFEAIDEYNRDLDRDILGRVHVRKGIRTIAQRVQNNWIRSRTNIRNKAATPRLRWHEFRLERMQDKLERKEAKAEAAINDPLLHEFRAAQAKAYKQNVVDARQQRVDTHASRIDERKMRAREKIQSSKEGYRAVIDGYRAQKQRALASRALRQHFKQVGDELGGVSGHERRIMARSMSPEQRQRIGRVAALEESAWKTATSLQGHYKASKNDRRHSAHRILEINKKAESLREQATGLRERLASLNGEAPGNGSSRLLTIPEARQRLVEAEDARRNITDISSPEYAAAQAHYEQTQMEVIRMSKIKREAETAIASLDKQQQLMDARRERLKAQLISEQRSSKRLDASRKKAIALHDQRVAALARTANKTTF